MSISFKELNGEIMNMRRELLKAKLVIASFAARIEALEKAQLPVRSGYVSVGQTNEALPTGRATTIIDPAQLIAEGKMTLTAGVDVQHP